MRICLFYIALSFISLSANAQSGMLFPHDTAAVFMNASQEKYFTAYIDSTSTDELGTHFGFKGDFSQNWTTILCWDTYCEAGNNESGEFGSVYTSTMDSTHIFVTDQGDSLKFNFNLAVGESSAFFSNNLHYFITRLLNSTSDTWVQGEIVSHYEITAMMDFDEIDTPFSGQVISIGALSGLHRFFDIQEFPIDYVEVELVGNTYFDAGIVPFTFTEAFDFQLAEVYQYQRSTGLPGSSSSSVDTYTVVSRADLEGSVTYQFEKESITTIYSADYEDIIPPEIIISAPSTVEFTYYDEQIAPNQYGPYYANQGMAGYGLFGQTDHFGEPRIQLTIGLDEGFYSCDDNLDCFFQTENPDYRYKKYVPGLGKVHEYFGIDNYGWSEQLIYFEKDGITWGQDITSVEDDQMDISLIDAYPNPSSGIVTLSRSVKDAVFYNSMGQVQTYINGSVVDLTAFAEGLYLLKPSGKNQEIIRIIKR